MKCPKCYHENPDDTSYCGKCGTNLAGSEGAAPYAAASGGEEKPPSSQRIPLAGLNDQVSVTRTLEMSTDELTRGTVFASRYEVIEELGTGGMGRVYRAYDTQLKEEVALKLIKPEIAMERKALERFRSEIKTARRITHKNVCRMHDLHEEGRRLFLTMEYVRGEDLKSLIHRTKALAVGTAVSIARQVAEGLLEAHKLDITHRDLKPANIMIDKEGQAKIMDFGIARVRHEKGVTGEGAVIGTPEYMSPEQVEGKPADRQSDIYSLGVILFEMVVGRPPFEGDTAFSIANKHKSEPAPDPRSLNPQVPPDLARLILRCLEKEPGKRYQTTDEIIADLAIVEAALPSAERVAAGRPPIKPRPAVSRKVTLELTPRKLLLPAIALVAVIGIVIGLIRFLPMKEAAAPLLPERSVAVLPFVDLSTDRSSEPLADGLSVELINALSRLRDLRVPGWTSASTFKGRNADVREISQKLGVRTVLEGEVQVMGERLRITARLIDAEGGYQVWSEKYDRTMKDLFGIQDEISLAIVENLKVTLMSGEKAALLKRSTADTEAYNLYLKGLYFVARSGPEALGKALDCFHQALDRDPNFALAQSGVGTVYLNKAALNLEPPAEMFQKAKAALKSALALDPDLPEAHELAATLELYFEWDWAAAEKSFERILALRPGSAIAHGGYAWLLMGKRRFEESMAEAKRAVSLEPLMPLFLRYFGTAISSFNSRPFITL
jgi:TolB-like protein